MKRIRKFEIVSLLAVFGVFTGAVNAAITSNQTYSGNSVALDDYMYNSSAGNTWTITGNASVGDGTTNSSRLFVGIGTGQVVPAGNGKLTLMGGALNSTLLINGYNSGDKVLGRFGQTNGGNFSATLVIDGGLAVTMGGRPMRYDANANMINILNGSLNYTTPGFVWQEGAEGSRVSHVISAGGSLIMPGVINDASDFTNYWAGKANSNVADVNDITVAAASGLYLQFTPSGGNTIITAIPEPGVFGLASFALLLGSFFGRRRK